MIMKSIKFHDKMILTQKIILNEIFHLILLFVYLSQGNMRF